MPPSRAPSLDLLRVLRRTSSSLVHPPSKPRCPSLHQIHSSAPRPFTTTSSFRVDDRSPSTQPPTSTNASQTNQNQSSSLNKINRYAPVSHDRGPTSTEDTQTDFGAMDIYAGMATPATSIDACTSDGFHLDNGVKITGYAGLIVAGGEAWTWRPWLALQNQTHATTTETFSAQISALLDARRGILTLPKQSLGVFKLLHPKPDLLIVGTGSKLWMLAPETKRYLMEELGMRVDCMDTANASATYNLLAKERGVDGGAGLGGAFLPIGWKGPEAKKRR